MKRTWKRVYKSAYQVLSKKAVAEHDAFFGLNKHTDIANRIAWRGAK